MPEPTLTIGMAHFDDFVGLWPTIQALRLYHGEIMPQTELLVVDNNADSEQGQMAEQFVENWVSHGMAGARWIAMKEPRGTSAPRDRVFREARGRYVVCIDPHVFIVPGALARLVEYYEAHPDTKDLLQGPLVYDDNQQVATHFDPVWRAEMYGVWATDERGIDPEGEPFEIPGQGLGLFSCRKDAWVGFHPALRGFGAEELLLHEKVRRNGGRTLCLPWLRWMHRFGRPAGTPYPLQRYEKVRNYIIWHNELELSLDPVHDHFVATGLMSDAEWDYLAANPIERVVPPGQLVRLATNGCGGQRPQPPEDADLDGIYQWCRAVPRDLDQHLPKLRELAEQCSHATEFAKRRESTVGLLAGRPKTLISYNLERDPLFDRLHESAKNEGTLDKFQTGVGDSLDIPEIEETELLFIDTQHNANRLWAELEKHAGQVRRYVVLHDTKLHGERGDDGGPGLLPAMRRFLNEHPEWSVVYHTDEQYGLTVLSRDQRDKPKLPGKIKMAANLAMALADHVADGGAKVSSASVNIATMIAAPCAAASWLQKRRCDPANVRSVNGTQLTRNGSMPRELARAQGWLREAEGKGLRPHGRNPCRTLRSKPQR